MLDINKTIDTCSICREEFTSIYVEARPGYKIYVCDNCLEAAKFNFIWICMNCGKVYIRPKSLVIKRISSYELKRAYVLCEDLQIIQGIDMCIACDPAGMLSYMKPEDMGMEC